ncbi:SDR family oxidoreductase [Roseovarius sp. CAU 1744]|uniref:SDR family oxidoreductase n=1 Tax=Roseovarius sp. CAU 1744 TaxID=3140368 RepID=UPI00325BAFA1
MHVVITGANRGIGRALAAHYHAAGDHVTGTARRDATLARLDVTDPDQQAAFAQSLANRPVDLLICNAGVYLDKNETFERGFPAPMWQQTFAANVTGVFLTVQALLPCLKRADAPKIAIISSIMASQTNAPGGSYIYRASKAAALNLGRNLAVDLAPDGIAVGIYHPGWVRTDMGGNAADITVEDAVAGLTRRFDDLSPEISGCFQTWDGRDLPF